VDYCTTRCYGTTSRAQLPACVSALALPCATRGPIRPLWGGPSVRRGSSLTSSSARTALRASHRRPSRGSTTNPRRWETHATHCWCVCSHYQRRVAAQRQCAISLLQPYRAQWAAIAVEDEALLGALLLYASSRRATVTQISTRLNQTIFCFPDGLERRAQDDAMRCERRWRLSSRERQCWTGTGTSGLTTRKNRI